MSEAHTLNKSLVATNQRAATREALLSALLPADDLESEGLALFAFDLDGEIIGYGGFESYGESVLIRSIVVAPARRRKGLGRGIVESVIAEATKAGAARFYLLTTDARGYFEKLGFAVIERSCAPAAILSTRQAAGLCPVSAALMVKALAG